MHIYNYELIVQMEYVPAMYNREEVYGRLTKILASREATSFFHIVVFTSMC